MPPDTPIHVFDTAFLPWLVRFAKVGFDAKWIEVVVERELRPVVLCQGSTKIFRHGCKPLAQLIADGLCMFAGLLGHEDKARRAFDGHQHGGTRFARMQEVGFPMSRLASFFDVRWPLTDGNAVFNGVTRMPGFADAAPFAFGAWQVKSPAVVIGAGDLRVNKTVDGLMADARRNFVMCQSAGNLFR